MRDVEFRQKYAAAYEVIGLCPLLNSRHGLGVNMNRDQAIRKIRALNKQECYAVVDDVPDKVIASQFRQYLAETSQEIRGNNLLSQIQEVWSRIVRKAH